VRHRAAVAEIAEDSDIRIPGDLVHTDSAFGGLRARLGERISHGRVVAKLELPEPLTRGRGERHRAFLH